MKKKTIFVGLLCSMFILTGCQSAQENIEKNPKVTNSSNTKNEISILEELAKNSTSTDEIYVSDDLVVGENGDVKPGIYDLEVTGGSGNIFGTRETYNGLYINFLGSANSVTSDYSLNYASKIRLILFDGDSLQLSNISKVKFNAVSQEVTPSNELSQGEFIVGRDIEPGTYKLGTNVNLDSQFDSLGWHIELYDLKNGDSQSQMLTPSNSDVVIKLKEGQILTLSFDVVDNEVKADDAKLIFEKYE